MSKAIAPGAAADVKDHIVAAWSELLEQGSAPCLFAREEPDREIVCTGHFRPAQCRREVRRVHSAFLTI
ncbi:hypothetical protein [Pelagerythrobacter aerophilus]